VSSSVARGEVLVHRHEAQLQRDGEKEAASTRRRVVCHSRRLHERANASNAFSGPRQAAKKTFKDLPGRDEGKAKEPSAIRTKIPSLISKKASSTSWSEKKKENKIPA